MWHAPNAFAYAGSQDVTARSLETGGLYLAPRRRRKSVIWSVPIVRRAAICHLARVTKFRSGTGPPRDGRHSGGAGASEPQNNQTPKCRRQRRPCPRHPVRDFMAIRPKHASGEPDPTQASSNGLLGADNHPSLRVCGNWDEGRRVWSDSDLSYRAGRTKTEAQRALLKARLAGRAALQQPSDPPLTRSCRRRSQI